METRFDLVVFDMAGTTVQDGGDVVARALAGALSDIAGLSVELSNVREVMGMAKPDALRQLAHDGGRELSHAEVARAHDRFVACMVRHYETGSQVASIPGARRTFEALRAAGIRVALDTGFSRPIVNAILWRLGWLEGSVIDAVVTADEVSAGRPDPASILRAMERCQVRDASRVAKVGDTPSDLRAGAAAGCGAVIGVGSGSSSLDALSHYPHSHLVKDVTCVPSVLGLPDLIGTGVFPIVEPRRIPARVIW